MPRTVRDAKLENRTVRGTLKPSGKPYYRAIDEGLHLGYRKGVTAGKWVIRWYVGDQKYAVETIGSADDTIDADGHAVLTFAQAQGIARNRFVERKRIAAGLPAQAGPYTVGACIEEYLAWLERNRKSAKDATWRAKALILPHLGGLACAKLTTRRLVAWRDAIADEPARLRTKKGKPQRFRVANGAEDPAEARRKRHASVNRVMTVLKAALNRAWRDDRKIPSDDAWRALEPFEDADAARIRYLTVAEAKRLINAAKPDFRNLVLAALATGARFGELAALQAGDFNPDTGTLHVRTSKSGKGRHIVLTEEGIEFFRGMAAGLRSGDRMLPKADGGKWLKSHQSRPMLDACTRAKIAPPASFHTLRHTYASLSIMNGAPLMVVARNLGHADTRMVEKHYAHMSANYVADAIRAAAPRFGIAPGGNVVPLVTQSPAG